MKINEYKCLECGDIWEFCPEDYDHWSEYPEICALCEMPIREMAQEVYVQEGVWAVIKRIWIRI